MRSSTHAARSVRIVLLMACVITAVSWSSPALAFEDVDGSVHRDDIVALEKRGVLRGCDPPFNNRFCPDDPLTRGQMAAILHRAFPDLPVPEDVDPFVDSGGSVFRDDIRWLAATGVTKGCDPPENRRFCPDDVVTRGEMAAFLVRTLRLEVGRAWFSDTKGDVFDGDAGRLATAGITSGCNPPDGDHFCPDLDVSRAEVASFVWRAIASVTGSRPGVRVDRVDGHPIAYCANGALDDEAEGAVIVVHGDTRNPCEYAQVLMDAAPPNASVRVLAPLFPVEEDAAYMDPGFVRWRRGAWKWGGSALDSAGNSVDITSFDLLDELVGRVREAGVATVVVAGHSAGGQLINRYTGAGNAFVDRYVISNPSSYAYLDDRRWDGREFSVPDDSCPSYDDWKYGLRSLRGGVTEVGPEGFRERMAARSAVYLLGGDDVYDTHGLDTSCAAMLQGEHRLDRGLRYAQHLAAVLGSETAARHRVEVVDGVGHSVSGMFGSDQGRRALFEFE